MATTKLDEIERCLRKGDLEDLFLRVLLWGRPDYPPQDRPVGAPVSQDVRFTPLAAMGDLPVFRVDWHKDKPPTIAERRAVLRALHQTYREHLLVYIPRNERELLFVWPKTVGEGRTARVELRTLPYTRGEPARTTVERLALLGFSLDEVGRHGVPTVQVLDRLDGAFDVEAVTKQFFTDYHRLFEGVERQVEGLADTAARRLFVQSLFNRLLFIVFLERKGWLTFQGKRDYLRALWADHLREMRQGEPSNFYRDRLKLLFFAGLNTPHEVDVVGIARDGFLQSRIGHVPYLNGGLFEESESDRDPDVAVPDGAFEPVIQELLYHYNFTVTESTPLDIEVAVDPEMLGRIFEELVTGRHESGSYYTPKQVVAFMCREALKGYLVAQCAREDETAIASLVDGRDGSKLHNAEAVLAAFRSVRVCDPACGSGAYLVGMLHELLDLRSALFVSKGLDPVSAYRRKLEIIQENLFGVDLDPFAVNIARLRLWLSLIVDFEDGAPPPLPNLDFKVEAGDSLTGPDPSSGLGAGFRWELVGRLFELKKQYLTAHGGAKLALRNAIDELGAQISAWAGRSPDTQGFDWAVRFAEVFASAGSEGQGGFDIVLANPPYVRADAQWRHIADEGERQEAIRQWKEYRRRLKSSRLYETLYEKWDLYIPFLERAYRLLKSDGQMVFIISDAYNAAKYARKSHEYFLNRARIVRLDFCSEIPLFRAGVANTIVHFARSETDSCHVPRRFRRWGLSPADFEANAAVLPSKTQACLGRDVFRPDTATTGAPGRGSLALERLCYVSYGLRANADDRYWRGEFTTEDCLSATRDGTHPKAFVQGKALAKWFAKHVWYLEWGTNRAPGKFSRPTFPQLHETSEKLIAARTPGAVPRVIHDTARLYFDASCVGFVPWHYLEAVTNRSVSKTAQYKWQARDGDREDRERLSAEYHPKYLLAIMNSTMARDWLARKRRSKLHVYPDDWKQLPVAVATPEEQQELVALVNAVLSEFAGHGYPLPDCAAERVAELEREIDDRVSALYAPVQVETD